MRLSGLPLTLLIIAASLSVSIILFRFGIYLFFLPIIFIPFMRIFKRTAKISHVCPVCALASEGNYCPRCGTRIL